MKLFLNIYDFFRTAVIKVFIDYNRGRKECSQEKMRMFGCCHTGTCSTNSKVLSQKTGRKRVRGRRERASCARDGPQHQSQQRGIKDAQTNASAENISHHRLRNVFDSLCQHPASVAAATREHRRALTQRLAELIQRGRDIIVQVTLSRS